MKTIRYALVLMLMVGLHAVQENGPSVAISKTKSACVKMPLGIVAVGEDIIIDELVYYLNSMLSCSMFKSVGFQPHLRRLNNIPSKQYLHNLYVKDSISVAFVVSRNENNIVWSLIDTHMGRILCSKQTVMPSYPIRFLAEHIADQVWFLLTGKDGFFSTRIACCREIRNGYKNLCLLPMYGIDLKDNNKLIDVLCSGKIVAPRWNNDGGMPMVLYSELTDFNVRLMAVSLDKKQRMVSNFKGLNLVPSFSSYESKVAFCLSCEGKSNIYVLDHSKQKNVFKKITYNEGNNISPLLLENGDMIFCSDFQNKVLKLYYWHNKNNSTICLTPERYAACPSYCAKTNQIAYCGYISGYMQIFVYDMKTKAHEQITFDAKNKQECSWSPCGNFLVFSVDQGHRRVIKVLYKGTKEQIIITSTAQRWSYPQWSPRYQCPLIV